MGNLRDDGIADIDKEFPLQGATTNKDREIVAAAVGQRKSSTDTASADFQREGDAVTDFFVAVAATNNGNFVVLCRDFFARFFEKVERENAILAHLEILDMNRRRIGTGINLRWDIRNAFDGDEGGGADNVGIFCIHKSIISHISDFVNKIMVFWYDFAKIGVDFAKIVV